MLRSHQRAWLDRSVEVDDNISQLIRSPVDQPPTYATANQDVIRRWARERSAQPAVFERAGLGDPTRRLDIAFSGDREDGLRCIDWSEWFDMFAAESLTFFYRTHRSDGVLSLYFRVADREAAI